MANGKVHKNIGRVVGGVTAYYAARDLEPLQCTVETIAGIFGGQLGAVLPDYFDPPVSPHHRSIAHGLLPVSYAISSGLPWLERFRAYCRERARHYDQRARAETDAAKQVWFSLVAFALRFLAGLTSGILGGYLSHLALDAGTPMSLPIIA